MRRLLATDLDGTLLRSDLTVSDATRAALRDAHESTDCEVLLVTGRPPRWVPAALEATGYAGDVICANGAAVFHADTGIASAVAELDSATITTAMTTLRALVPEVEFDFAVELVALREGDPEFVFGTDYQPAWAPPPGSIRSTELESWPGVIKLLGRARPKSGHAIDALWQRAVPALSGVVEVTHSNSRDLLLEMSPAGVSKASTLAQMVQGLDVSRANVVAVGDMPNDLPMLAWAGIGCAVANAHPLVRDAVEVILPSNDDDGVALALHSLISDSISTLGGTD